MDEQTVFSAGSFIGHQLAALFIWAILEGFTSKSSFRENNSSRPLGNRYPWLISLGLAFALISPFVLPSYPPPDVANYGLLISRLLYMVVGTGVFSLIYWIRFAKVPNLRELYLAIVGMLTSGAGVFYLILVGAGSPV